MRVIGYIGKMFSKIKILSLYILVFVFSILQALDAAANQQVVNVNNAKDLITCLDELTDGNGGFWVQNRTNGGGQTLRDHLFFNHSGRDGHSMIVQPAAGNLIYANSTDLATAIAGVVGAINNEILRRVNRVGTPLANFTALRNGFVRNALPARQTKAILNFFGSHTKALDRRFGISLSQDINLPPNAPRVVPITRTNPTRAPKKLWIYLPNGNQRIPETVFLD